jgi:hypothetical protein
MPKVAQFFQGSISKDGTFHIFQTSTCENGNTKIMKMYEVWMRL